METEISQLIAARKPFLAHWSLLGEWWCYPANPTEDEQLELVHAIKEQMSSDFNNCPDRLIRQRIFGGFHCPEDGRHHAYFMAGAFSFIAAAEGNYGGDFETDRRLDAWDELANGNPGQPFDIADPFAQDFPGKYLKEGHIIGSEEGSEG